MEGASPGVWPEMGVAGMMSRLAGVHGGCEPVEVAGDGRYRHGERARGFMEGASPWRWLKMGVTGMMSGLAGVRGGCEPV